MTARTLPAALALASSLPAAAGMGEDIQSRGEIRLGDSVTKASFSFKAHNDVQPAGFSVELCRRVAEAVARRLAPKRLRVEWVALDPETRLTALSSGQVDIEKIYQAWLLPLGKPGEGLAAVYAVNALPE